MKKMEKNQEEYIRELLDQARRADMQWQEASGKEPEIKSDAVLLVLALDSFIKEREQLRDSHQEEGTV